MQPGDALLTALLVFRLGSAPERVKQCRRVELGPVVEPDETGRITLESDDLDLIAVCVVDYEGLKLTALNRVPEQLIGALRVGAENRDIALGQRQFRAGYWQSVDAGAHPRQLFEGGDLLVCGQRRRRVSKRQTAAVANTVFLNIVGTSHRRVKGSLIAR